MPELDTKLDLGKLGSAELDLIIGRTVAKVMSPPDRMTLWRQLGAPIIKKVDFAGTVVSGQGAAAQGVFFPFAARPQVGRMWSVRKVIVQATGGTWRDAALANVTGGLFVTQGGGASNWPSPIVTQDVEQAGFTVPTTQFYSTHQLWVRGGEWFVFGAVGSGVTTGVQFWGHARVVEIDDSPEFLMTL